MSANTATAAVYRIRSAWDRGISWRLEPVEAMFDAILGGAEGVVS